MHLSHEIDFRARSDDVRSFAVKVKNVVLRWPFFAFTAFCGLFMLSADAGRAHCAEPFVTWFERVYAFVFSLALPF